MSLQKSKVAPLGRVLLTFELDSEGDGKLLQGFIEQRPSSGITVKTELPGCGEDTRKELDRCQVSSQNVTVTWCVKGLESGVRCLLHCLQHLCYSGWMVNESLSSEYEESDSSFLGNRASVRILYDMICL